jgi:hypothetical protein
VQHSDCRVKLIGVRAPHGQEFSPERYADAFGWPCVGSYALNSFDECLEACKALNPMRNEGYVVCDAAFNRVKVKSPQYVALSHMKECMSGRRLLELARSNESDEFLTYFPEFAQAFGVVKDAYDSLCRELESAYILIRDIPEQKAFAVEALKTRCSSPLFAMRKGACKSVREFFGAVPLQAVEKSLGLDLNSLICLPESEAVLSHA